MRKSRQRMHLKRIEILNAAQTAILTTGPATRMADVAKRLGIETSSLYYYFKGMPEILNELLAHCRYDLPAYEAQIVTPEKQKLTVLYELLSYLLRFYHEHAELMGLLLTQTFPLFQSTHLEEDYRSINAYLTAYRQANEVLLRYLRDAHEEGTITKELPPETLLLLLRGTIWGMVASWQEHPPEESALPGYVQRLMRLIK
jgi:AcrR family transcriptional regulator